MRSPLDQHVFHFFLIFISDHSQFNSHSCSHSLLSLLHPELCGKRWQCDCESRGREPGWTEEVTKDWKNLIECTHNNKHCRLETPNVSGGQRSRANKGIGPHSCLGPWEPQWQSPGTNRILWECYSTVLVFFCLKYFSRYKCVNSEGLWASQWKFHSLPILPLSLWQIWSCPTMDGGCQMIPIMKAVSHTRLAWMPQPCSKFCGSTL